MNGRRIEHFHHTDEQVEDVLRKAALIVERLPLSDDLRVSAFVAAANLLAQKSITQEMTPIGVPALAIPKAR